jgi:hypothetical protein
VFSAGHAHGDPPPGQQGRMHRRRVDRPPLHPLPAPLRRYRRMFVYDLLALPRPCLLHTSTL